MSILGRFKYTFSKQSLHVLVDIAQNVPLRCNKQSKCVSWALETYLPINKDGEIDLRELEVNVVHSAEELQAKVYPNFENNFGKAEWLWDALEPRSVRTRPALRGMLAQWRPGQSVRLRQW